jgi:hypothetical protein
MAARVGTFLSLVAEPTNLKRRLRELDSRAWFGLSRSVNKNSRFSISNDQGTTIFATVFAIVFLQNHSGDSEHALLARPVQRQPHSFDESLRGELGGLPARGNDLDDCGR